MELYNRDMRTAFNEQVWFLVCLENQGMSIIIMEHNAIKKIQTSRRYEHDSSPWDTYQMVHLTRFHNSMINCMAKHPLLQVSDNCS